MIFFKIKKHKYDNLAYYHKVQILNASEKYNIDAG